MIWAPFTGPAQPGYECLCGRTPCNYSNCNWGRRAVPEEYQSPVPHATGWRCPGCGACYAPFVPQCIHCSPPVQMTPAEHAAPSKPHIVCAAIRCGQIVVCGPRHFDAIMHSVIELLPDIPGGRTWEQGFVDQHGRFYGREQAWAVASTNGQIINRVGGDDRRLYSENLY